MRKNILLLSLSILALSLPLGASDAKATTLLVSKACGTTAYCYATIGEAVTQATSSATVDIIEIRPGTYNEAVTLTKSITLKGTETARTIIQNSNPVITVGGFPNVFITRLTIAGTSVGIEATNAANLNINNNIFWGGGTGTAIVITGTSTADIDYNTFFSNATAISSSVDLTVTNNIFSTNTTALASTGIATFTNVENNLFHLTTTLGPFAYDKSDPAETNIPSNISGRTNDDPKFVASAPDFPNRDLHLQEGSGAIGTGAGGTEIGAFGGSGADNIPFPVSGLVVTSVTGTSPASVAIQWNPNLAYPVAGYLVYFGTKSGQYSAPLDTLSTNATYTITGLTSAVASAPTGTPVVAHTIQSGLIELDWSSSLITNVSGSGTIGYEIRYDTQAGVIPPPDPPSGSTVVIDAKSELTYPLAGLTNYATYYFIVTPYSQSVYYLAVKPYYTGTSVNDAFSNEVTAGIGDKVYGNSSVEDSDFPEPVVAMPNLPNDGCFIATAAYGYYSAPQVQVLRDFRDRYLVTNRAGKAFVAWYYRYGPVAAAFMNDHAWVKPVVRAALLPAVAGAWFMVHAPLRAGIAVILIIGFLVPVTIILRRNNFRNGGIR